MPENFWQTLNPVNRLRQTGQNFGNTRQTLASLVAGGAARNAWRPSCGSGRRSVACRAFSDATTNPSSGRFAWNHRPEHHDRANQAQTMANLLGIPNYAGGNSGLRTPASS